MHSAEEEQGGVRNAEEIKVDPVPLKKRETLSARGAVKRPIP